MHRIDGPGAVNSLFTEGDPSVPQMATVVTAAWLNDVQENLAKVIEAAGITLQKGNFDQLRQAINQLSGSGEIGEIKLWPSETLPANGDWMECDGASLLRVDYQPLFDVIGDLFGPATTGYFKLPNLRGRVPRGWDHGAGVDPDAALRVGGDHVGSTQEDAVKKHNHPLGNGGGAQGSSALLDYQAWNKSGTAYNVYSCDFAVTGDAIQPAKFDNVPQGLETRMKNLALMFLIRWR